MIKFSLLSALLFLSFASFAQKTHTISDPEIEFSLTAPNDWVVEDDGFYYLLFIPTGNGLDQLSITYFETNEQTPNDQFEGLIKAALPLNEAGYELLGSGDDEVDGQPAKWAIFNSTKEGVEIKSIVYMFISQGQIFNVRGTAKRGNFSQHHQQFKTTIRSLKAKRI